MPLILHIRHQHLQRCVSGQSNECSVHRGTSGDDKSGGCSEQETEVGERVNWSTPANMRSEKEHHRARWMASLGDAQLEEMVQAQHLASWGESDGGL